MTPPPNLQELIDVVRDDSPTPQPLDQLSTASATAAQLGDVTDALLGHYVDRARRAGHSWTEISTVLGVSKQAAHKRFAGPTFTPTFERFTDRARNVLEASTSVAREIGHPYVGTEHVLLALFTEPEGIAARVIDQHGITEEAVRGAVLSRIPARDEIPSGALPYTPRASAVLEQTLREALALGHNYIGTEHMLLALYGDPTAAAASDSGFRSGGGLAAEVLTELGLDRDAGRASVIQLLSGYQR
jgi:Clp amino terminal domain, pathogenicity island component